MSSPTGSSSDSARVGESRGGDTVARSGVETAAPVTGHSHGGGDASARASWTVNQETESSPTSIRIYGGVGRSCLAAAPWPRRATTSCSTTARAGAFGRRTSPTRLRPGRRLGPLGPTPEPGLSSPNHKARQSAHAPTRRRRGPRRRSGPDRVPALLLGGIQARMNDGSPSSVVCTTNFPIYQRRSCARRCKLEGLAAAPTTGRSILEGSCGRTKPSGSAARPSPTRPRRHRFPNR